MWPTLAEIQTKLALRGLTVPPDAELTAIIDGVIAEWDSMTGYSPFLAETNPVTRTFDPPAWRTGTPAELDLRNGYVEITSVKVFQVDGAGGTTLTLGSTGYQPWPQDAPYRRLLLAFYVSGMPNTIEVIGRRGYSDSIPADAWKALYDVVVARVAQEQSGGDVSKMKQGPVEMTYTTSTIGKAEDTFKNVAAGYRRISL